MRRITSSASICFGSGICTRIPCTASSALRRSTCSSSSACVVSAGSRTVTLCMPASSDALPFERTYTALAGSSPTSTTASPGRTPAALSCAACRATSSRMPRAIDVPSMSSAGKVDRPRLANDDDLDLPRILQLALDAPRDLLGERGRAAIVHVLGRHDDADLAARLDGEDLVDATIARRDPLESLETLHVRLERLAARSRPRSRDRVGRLHEHRDLRLVRH